MALKHSKPFVAYKRARALRAWKRRGYAAPSPANMKEQVLRRNGIAGATWVETGTYRGDTTAFLAEAAPRVITIEPSEKYHREAVARFRGTPAVEVIHGASETVFPELLPTLSGDVCFWLDGHYSAGNTFQGAVDTPIVAELDVIRQVLGGLGRISVLVDDVRLFGDDAPENQDYPPLDFLVDWARDAGLRWHIEHDIFVARTP